MNIPDEALKFFVRLMIMDYAQSKDLQSEGSSCTTLGYTSGLFDGSRNVCSSSVEEYYKEVKAKIKEIETEFGRLGMYERFGVHIKYVKKNKPNI